MADRFDYNPYSTQDSVYGGAASNGQQGSQTANSQVNSIVQQPAGRSDPFSSFGNAAQQWARLLDRKNQNQNPQNFQQAIPTPNVPVSTQPGAGQFVPLTPTLPTLPTIPGRTRAVSPSTPDATTSPGNLADLTPTLPAAPITPVGAGGRTRAVAPVNPATPAPPDTTTTGPQPWTNPVPKPSNPNDLEGMAAYYRGFANDPQNGDPSFANITAADVGNYRMLAIDGKTNLSIGDWIKAGRPGGQWTPPPATPNPNTLSTDGNIPLQTGVGGGNLAGGAGGSSNGTTGTGTNPGGGSNGDLQSLMDYYKQLMGPLHQQEQEDYLRQLSTVGANSGAINSGAYLDAQDRGMADLIHNENAGLYGNLFTGSESAKDRAIQKAIAEISGSSSVQAAQLHASAAEAAAAQSAGASRYGADLDYRKFQEQLPYDDKWHGYNYQLGQDQLSAQQYQYLMSLMSGLTFPPAGLLPTLPQGGFFP